MKIDFNYNNADNFLFNSFNQRKNKKYYYWCAIFAPIINITTNCKKTHHIEFTRNDIDEIWARMIQAWKMESKGAAWLDWVNYVYSYLKEEVAKGRKNTSWNLWKVPNLATFYNEDEEELMKWINRWYTAIIWIGVNSEFVKDMIDGKIEKYSDYKNYKWEQLKHFTNIWKWLRSEEKYWEEFVLDSYAHHKWMEWMYWNFNIKEAFEDICFRSKYIFF